MSLVYVERILQRHQDFRISRQNVHRFVVSSVLVGSKILDDFYCRNVYYAMAAGLTKAELNQLELKLCDLLDFDLHVQPSEFSLYRDSLIRKDAGKVADAIARAVSSSLSLSSASSPASSAASSASSSPMAEFGMPPSDRHYTPLSAHPLVPKPTAMGVVAGPPPPPMSAWGQPRDWSMGKSSAGFKPMLPPSQQLPLPLPLPPQPQHSLQLPPPVPNVAIVLQQQQHHHHEQQRQQQQQQKAEFAAQRTFAYAPTQLVLGHGYSHGHSHGYESRHLLQQQQQQQQQRSLPPGLSSVTPRAWSTTVGAPHEAVWKAAPPARDAHQHHQYNQLFDQPPPPPPLQPDLLGRDWMTADSRIAAVGGVPSNVPVVSGPMTGYLSAPLAAPQSQDPFGVSDAWFGSRVQPMPVVAGTSYLPHRMPIATTLWGAPQVV